MQELLKITPDLFEFIEGRDKVALRKKYLILPENSLIGVNKGHHPSVELSNAIAEKKVSIDKSP